MDSFRRDSIYLSVTVFDDLSLASLSFHFSSFTILFTDEFFEGFIGKPKEIKPSTLARSRVC